jgi:hypothetical protein
MRTCGGPGGTLALCRSTADHGVPASASVLPKHTLVYHIFVKFFYSFIGEFA